MGRQQGGILASEGLSMTVSWTKFLLSLLTYKTRGSAWILKTKWFGTCPKKEFSQLSHLMASWQGEGRVVLLES